MALTDTSIKFLITAEDKTGAGVTGASTGLEKLRAAAGAVNGALAALGATAIFSGIVSQIGQVVDEMDDAYKAAQKVGLSVESFTALKYAAELSGVPVEQLVSSIGRLNRSLFEAAGNGESPQAKALAALGVSATDASGKIRAADVVLSELADRFAALPDGPEKAALAMELFGKSGADLIPLLNSGKEGIRALTDEAKKLGVVMSTESAKAAEELNDNLERLAKSWKGLKIEAASGLLPVLSEIFEASAKSAEGAGRATKAWEGFKAGWQALGNGIRRLVGLEETRTDVTKLASEAKKLATEKSLPTAFRDAEAASKALEKSLREQAAAAKSAGEVAKQEANVKATGIKLSIEQAKTEYELAKAKGNTTEITAAKNKITVLETELARANAAAAIAEAENAIAVAQAKYKEALAKNENVEATEKELEAAALAYKAKVLQSEIIEENISRTDKLEKVTSDLSASNVSTAVSFGHMADAAWVAKDAVEALAEMEQRLADIRDKANAARQQGGTADWEYLLGARGIKLSAEEMERFKGSIESIYEYLRGTFDGKVVDSNYLLTEAIRRATELARTPVGEGGGTPTSTTSTNTTTSRTTTTEGTSRNAGGVALNITVNGPADAEGLARLLIPHINKIGRLRS